MSPRRWQVGTTDGKMRSVEPKSIKIFELRQLSRQFEKDERDGPVNSDS